MSAIHLIERTDAVRKINKNKNEWESGSWPVTEEIAQKLVGGSLFLHRGKRQAAHFGGEILSYRIEETGPAAGLVVFTVRAKAECKGAKTDSKGWSKDLKVVANTPVSDNA